MKSHTPRPSRTQSLARVSTLAAVATASGAHAAIVFNSTTITSDNSTAGPTYWNIDGTGRVEVSLSNYSASSSISKYLGLPFSETESPAAGAKVVVNGGRINGGRLLGLAASVPIGSSRLFKGVGVNSIFNAQGALDRVTNFTSGEATYIGFQFYPSGTVGGTVLYGWANVTLTPGGTFGTFTINNWAYEDTGAPILTGQMSAIPEPANYAVGLGALALGAAGLRRRRQARAVAA